MACVIGGLAACSLAIAQERGLSLPASATEAPRWQARIEREPGPLLAWQAGTPLWLLDLSRPRMLRLLGDVQFSTGRLGDIGGLRLTGGVLLSTRPVMASGAGAEAVWPVQQLSGSGYAGVGYSSASARGDWGFRADLGLSGLNFGAPATSAITHSPGLRDARTGPVLRLGMNLSF